MIEDLISRVFATRNAAHLAHWAETSGWRHKVLGKFYAFAIDSLDSIVEAHIGAFKRVGEVKSLTVSKSDFADHLADEANWIAENRDELSGGVEGIGALLDDLVALYLSTHYKLTKLS